MTLTFDLLSKNFNLGHSFLTRRGRAFLCTPCHKTFLWIPKFWPSYLDLEICPTLTNFNLGISFLTRRGRAFIFHVCIPCSKIFNAVPTNMIFDVVTLTLKFDLLYKTIDGDYDFWITGVIYCCYLHMVAAGELCCLSDNSGYSCRAYLVDSWWNKLISNISHYFRWGEQRWSSCKALGLRSKRSGVRFTVSPLEFQRLVISCFQVVIWLK